MDDMKNKGRSPKGFIGNKNNRITKEKFLEIIELLKEETNEKYNEKCDRIAKEVNVSSITIKRIKGGKHK